MHKGGRRDFTELILCRFSLNCYTTGNANDASKAIPANEKTTIGGNQGILPPFSITSNKAAQAKPAIRQVTNFLKNEFENISGIFGKQRCAVQWIPWIFCKAFIFIFAVQITSLVEVSRLNVARTGLFSKLFYFSLIDWFLGRYNNETKENR